MSSDDRAAIEKQYISAEQLLNDSFRLGVQIAYTASCCLGAELR